MTPNDGENGLSLASPRSPEFVTPQAYRALPHPQTHNFPHKRTTSGATRQRGCYCLIRSNRKLPICPYHQRCQGKPWTSDYECGPRCDHEGVTPKLGLLSAAALLVLASGCAEGQSAEVAPPIGAPASTELAGFDPSVCWHAPSQNTEDWPADLLHAARQREMVLVDLAADSGPLAPDSDVIERFGNAVFRDKTVQSDAHLDGDLDDSELVKMAAARAAYLRASGRYVVLVHELSETAGLVPIAESVETVGAHTVPMDTAEAQHAFNRMATDLEVACGLGFLGPDSQPAPTLETGGDGATR